MSPAIKNKKPQKAVLEAGVTLGSSAPEGRNDWDSVGVSMAAEKL